jgi:hypothetical protein
MLEWSIGVEEEVPKHAIRHVDTLITVRSCGYCYCILRRKTSWHQQPTQSLGLRRPTSVKETGFPCTLLGMTAVYSNLQNMRGQEREIDWHVYAFVQLRLRDTIVIYS